MSDRQATQVNLMIVDDDPENIRALGRCLPRGYHYKSASNGLDALNQLLGSEEIPDLILLDMLMPGMDGVEVCRRIGIALRVVVRKQLDWRFAKPRIAAA